MTNDGELRLDGDRRALRFERDFDATPEELWSALTEPEQLAGWLAQAPRFEVWVGGAVELRFGDSEEEHVQGRVRTVEPNRVLEYDWTYPGETESVVRFELVPREGGTRLVLDHRALAPDAAAGYGAGWHAHLDGLAAHVVGRAADWDARFSELLPAYRERAGGVSRLP